MKKTEAGGVNNIVDMALEALQPAQSNTQGK